ncbi:MAG: peptidase S41, partial [Saprospiraceae bacterium]
MLKILLSGIWMMISLSIDCQPVPVRSHGNFDFEDFGHGLPVALKIFGPESYVVSVDSTIVRSGKYSVSIEFTGGDIDFKAISFVIPEPYTGKFITLSGYMKTENVSEGFAGLWMRIDPQVAFDNMHAKDIKGTTEWTPYEITLPMNPAKTKQIVIGALMAGRGKIWVDDLKITIDGKELADANVFVRKTFPAEKDKEFDMGSLVNEVQLDEIKIERLKKLGLIWGFLKYYHPNIAGGNYNWDYELFRILPKVLQDNKSLDNELFEWIAQLGSFERMDEFVLSDGEIKLQPDLDWIENSHFSEELKILLQRIKNAKRLDENYYVGLSPNVGNPEFGNENRYDQMKYTDAGYRLLSLFRYWNIIQYYFPYKNLIEEDWKDVLTEFIPKFFEAQNEKDYTMTVLELIGRVHDTHANIWGPNEIIRQYRGIYYAPVQVEFVENMAVVIDFLTDSGKEETGLQIGDVILEVNHETVESLIQRRLKYTPASNYPTKLRDIAIGLLRTQDS